MKLHILAFGAHPDDVELGCAGTLVKHIASGKKIGIADLTQGELGTRGTVEGRKAEAEAARKILGAEVRINLKLADGFFENDQASRIEVIKRIRQYRPDIVIANSPEDRHPDHGRAAQLVSDACFLSGLPKIKTLQNGEPQEAWRPRVLYHYIQYNYHKPDLLADITAHWEKKMESVRAHASQFYDPNSKEPETLISSKDFFDHLRARHELFGKEAGVKLAEGFLFGTLNKELKLL